jgi:hypothetical protein
MADMFDKEELGIVGSLFGTTPEALQLARENVAYTRGTNAGTNPSGAILGQSGMFAERGAAGLRGALGQQNPEEQVSALRQQAAQQFDPNTAEGLSQIAQFLNQNGDAAGARQAVMLAQGQAQKQATFGKTIEETRLLGRKEIEIGVDPKNPEMVQKALVDKDGNILKLLGQPYSKFNQKTTIDARTYGPKNVLELDSEQAKTYQTSLQSAAKTLPTLQRMQELLDSGVISGAAANWRAQSLGVLQSLGMNTDKAAKNLANTETFNKEMINLLQGVIKQYGANPSNVDVKTALQGLPELVKSPQGIQQVLTTLKKSNQDTYNEAKTGLDYYRKNQGSFTGYEPKVPLGLIEEPKITITKPLNQMSAEEIKAALKQ